MTTIKQKLAYDKAMENHGNISRAMIDAGYSPASAKNPKNLTESAGWKELVKTHLGDEKLAKKHDQLLNATHLEKLDFNGETSDEEIAQVVSEMEGYKLLKIVERISESGTVYAKYAYVKAPDNQTQDKALDKAYKIKGSYAPEKSININVDVDSESRRKGQEAIKQFLSK